MLTTLKMLLQVSGNKEKIPTVKNRLFFDSITVQDTVAAASVTRSRNQGKYGLYKH